MPKRARRRLRRLVVTMALLGFASGLPFPLVYSTLTAWLQEAGVPMGTLATFAWLGFAYSFKFLWAPLVDAVALPWITRRLGRRRSWILVSQLGVALGLGLLSTIDPAADLRGFALVAAAVALCSATQDVAIDAFRIESAATEEQGVLAAAYQYGYRAAWVVGGAGALVLAEVRSWQTSYAVMALAIGVGVAAVLRAPEPSRSGDLDPAPGAGGGLLPRLRRAALDPLREMIGRLGRAAVAVLALVALFRMSDYALGILANPFYLAMGFSKQEIAAVAKVYGLGVALLGTAAGGWAVLRVGIPRCLVAATALMAATNLAFLLLADGRAEIGWLALAISADNFAGGFSGTVLIAYLSSLTRRGFSATQYALLSSLSVFLGKLVAGYSGQVQERIGWEAFFLYTTLLGAPALGLAIRAALRDSPPPPGKSP